MAIAGKVAPTYDGDWSADKSYQQHTYVRYNDDAYIAIKASVGIEPTNEEYWFLALKNVSQAQLDALNNRINQIQTTSSGTLSQAGWYRVAEYDVQSHTNGGSGNGCIIHISNFHSNNNSESHTIQLRSTYGSQEFDSLGSKSSYVTRLFSKIRYTHGANKAYIEVYYAINSSNPAYFKVNSGDILGYWQAITPTLTSETVDGVTVTTTYDIPANASPVTDLDLVQFKGTEILTSSVLAKAVELPNGVYNYSLGSGSYVGEDLPDSYYSHGDVTIYKRSPSCITVVLWGVGAYMAQMNFYEGSEWHGWKKIATTADLANYLPKSGGTVTGVLTATFYNYPSIIVETTSSIEETHPAIEFRKSGSKNGAIAMDKNSDIHVYNGVYWELGTLLHTGNSAAVAVTASAPSDTSVLWYDTVNKMLKRYVDGAWQQ